jgi:hypothetical protein
LNQDERRTNEQKQNTETQNTIKTTAGQETKEGNNVLVEYLCEDPSISEQHMKS